MRMSVRIMIRGAGDLASGIAWRLYQAGYKEILMAEIGIPTTVRRTVAFSPAVYQGEMTVEGVTAKLVTDPEETEKALEEGHIALIVDFEAESRKWYKPDILIDAILAKRNLGTKIDYADFVIGVGPGFTAQVDCNCVVETKRGHYLGRVLTEGSAVPDTGVPGNIGGFTSERIIRAGGEGSFHALRKIGDLVKRGEKLAEVTDDLTGQKTVTYANIDGVVRGMLQENVHVTEGMKSGDVDPRGQVEYCETISDKALGIAGGVLQAVSAFDFSRR